MQARCHLAFAWKRARMLYTASCLVNVAQRQREQPLRNGTRSLASMSNRLAGIQKHNMACLQRRCSKTCCPERRPKSSDVLFTWHIRGDQGA